MTIHDFTLATDDSPASKAFDKALHKLVFQHFRLGAQRDEVVSVLEAAVNTLEYEFDAEIDTLLEESS